MAIKLLPSSSVCSPKYYDNNKTCFGNIVGLSPMSYIALRVYIYGEPAQCISTAISSNKLPTRAQSESYPTHHHLSPPKRP